MEKGLLASEEGKYKLTGLGRKVAAHADAVKWLKEFLRITTKLESKINELAFDFTIAFVKSGREEAEKYCAGKLKDAGMHERMAAIIAGKIVEKFPIDSHAGTKEWLKEKIPL